MGKDSEILWTEHTFNPWWGCTKVSDGCAHCYAETWAKRTGFSIWGSGMERRYFGAKHWAEPVKWDAAARSDGVMDRVFCGSMCDILEDRDDVVDARMAAFDLAEATPNLLWLFLSKRPENAVMMFPQRWAGTTGKWPHNVMFGVTIENQKWLDWRMPRIVEFRQHFAGAKIFASCEPLLSALDWSKPEDRGSGVEHNYYLQFLTWLVAGGESGPGARPCNPAWARKLRDDCRDRDDMCRPWPLPFLWKQWGEHSDEGVRVGKWKAGRLIDGVEWAQIPRLTNGLRVRQLPEVPR